MLSQTPGNSKYVQEYALDLKKFFDGLPRTSEEVLLGDLNDCQDVVMKDLKLINYSEGAVIFSFKVKTPGQYYIFASINEEAVGGSCILSISENPDGEPMTEMPEDDYETMVRQAKEEEDREEKEKERQFLAAKRMQQEEEMRRAEEELRQKTKDRADQNLKQHLMDKKIKEMREIQQKKERADLRVGGGFDLDKYATKKKSEKERESAQDQAKALLAERNRKESMRARDSEDQRRVVEAYSEVVEPPARQGTRQMSLYEGVQMSDYNDTEIDPQELQSPMTHMQAGQRPGSGYKIRDLQMKRSRPSSRLLDEAPATKMNNLDLMNNYHGSSFIESQLISRNDTSDTMKRQPVKAMVRTGDRFFNPSDVMNPELTQSRDLRDSKGMVNIKDKINQALNHERNMTGYSQTRDEVSSSQSNRKSFKIASSSSKPMRRGMSQEKVKVEPQIPEDKTAPKKSKGGMSLQRKPDPHRMPMIGAGTIKALSSQLGKPKRR